MLPPSESPNPYQPPSTALSSGPLLVDDREGQTPVRRWFDLVTLLLVALASGAYLAFIGILVNSSPIDRIAGYLFIANVPLLGAWVVQLWRRRRVGFSYGLLVVAGQSVITLAMISLGIGDFWEVVRINGWITLGFLLLTLQCHGVLRIADSTRSRSRTAS